MSSVRRGVLRTVRLLPGAVKIGDDGAAVLRPLLPEENEENSALERLQSQLAATEKQLRSSEEKRAALESELTQLREQMASQEEAALKKLKSAKNRAVVAGKAKGRSEGWGEGYGDGMEKARADVEAEYRKKFNRLAKLTDEISDRVEEHFKALVALNQPRMIRLWTAALKKILQREVELDPKAVVPVLHELLSHLSDKNDVVINLAPTDEAFVRKFLGSTCEFAELLRGIRHLELKADPSVEKGGCVVETSLGVYDARWRTQLASVDETADELFRRISGDSSENTAQAPTQDVKTDAVVKKPAARSPKKTAKKAAPKIKPLENATE